MSNMEIKVGKKYYKNHPKNKLFASNSEGRVIEFPSLKQVDGDEDGNILVKTYHNKEKLYSKITLIWECHHGLKKKDEYIYRLDDNENNDEIINLKLCKVIKKQLSPDERLLRNKLNREKWRNTVWDCPLCSFRTTNGAKWAHKRLCKYSDNPFTEEERQRKRAAATIWNHKKFTCKICGNKYNNSYKSVHTYFCEKKHCKVE